MPQVEGSLRAAVVRSRRRSAGVRLSPARADLWLIDLDLEADAVVALEIGLSPDEAARIGRFRQPLQRARRIVAHAVVRSILADYLGSAPGELEFEYDGRGKPSVFRASLQFSLSYGDDIAVCAIAASPVGVDVEPVRPGAAEPWVAALAPEAWRRVRSLPPAERSRAFLRAWTRMEATVKGAGVSLDRGLALLPLLVAPATNRVDLPEARAEAMSPSWHLRDLALGLEYIGALATPAPCDVRICHWPAKRLGSAVRGSLRVLPGSDSGVAEACNDSCS